MTLHAKFLTFADWLRRRVVFLGWTIAGWLLAFVWSFTGRTEAQVRLEEKRHQEMLAMVASSKK